MAKVFSSREIRQALAKYWNNESQVHPSHLPEAISWSSFWRVVSRIAAISDGEGESDKSQRSAQHHTPQARQSSPWPAKPLLSAHATRIPQHEALSNGANKPSLTTMVMVVVAGPWPLALQAM